MAKEAFCKVWEVLQNAPLSFEAGMVGQGIVGELERKFSEWLGVKYALAVPSCTFALYIALKSVGVSIGDEVIVPAYDWFSATAAVLHCGALPVFADVDEKTYTIDPNSVAERISPATKAIVATHLFGNPADLLRLLEVARAHGVALIEDAAQALGAERFGRKVGTLGDLACFSFGVGKILSCGEGGMVVTNEERFYERSVALCQHPLRQQWEGIMINPFALKAPINPLAAAYLLERWGEWERELAKRQRAFQRLNGLLEETGVLQPVFVREGDVHSCHRFCPTVAKESLRKSILIALNKAGIPAAQGPLDRTLPKKLHEALKAGQLWWHPFPEPLKTMASLPCPVAERLCGTLITLDWQVGSNSKGLVSLRQALSEICKGFEAGDTWDGSGGKRSVKFLAVEVISRGNYL
jgi:perosamine synthetase